MTRTMDEISSYRTRHHQAYLARKNVRDASSSSNRTIEESKESEPAVAHEEVTAPAEIKDDAAAAVYDTILEDQQLLEATGDPLYEDSLALARSLQGEIDREEMRQEEDSGVRNPDSVFEEQIIGDDFDDAELQAAIAKSLIEM